MCDDEGGGKLDKFAESSSRKRVCIVENIALIHGRHLKKCIAVRVLEYACNDAIVSHTVRNIVTIIIK